MLQIIYLAAALLLALARADDTAHGDTCTAPDPWEAAIEDWATAERGNLTRHGRIMSLPPSQGYYVTDRIDLVPPPPPRPHHHPPHSQLHHRGPHPMPGYSGQSNHGPPTSGAGPPGNSYGHSPSGASGPPPGNSYNHGPSVNPSQQSSGNSYLPSGPQSHGSPSGGPNHGAHAGGASHGPPSGSQGPQGQQGSMPYDEWQATPPPPPGAGKIVNRPPNPYKDQFKPSYAPPTNQPIPVQSADRVDTAPPAPPQKQVSETDLYLLRAIEKLVYRVDLMEKRMRKMEESVHYIVAGAEAKPEPCPSNFTRIGSNCYHFSSDSVNWKSASYACRKLKANLLELDADEKRQFAIGVQANQRLKGADFWTGGLNPGLLWIWSHSAKPVPLSTDAGSPAPASSSSSSPAAAPEGGSIPGEGRCLALLATPSADYAYRGQDCALRHRYVCERDEDNEKLSNEIERVAKSLRDKRKPKIAWD